MTADTIGSLTANEKNMPFNTTIQPTSIDYRGEQQPAPEPLANILYTSADGYTHLSHDNGAYRVIYGLAQEDYDNLTMAADSFATCIVHNGVA